LWDSVASEAIATNVVVNVPLIEAFEKALKDSNIPNNITNAILNLAEFMDLQDKMLPFDIPLLAQNAGSRSGMLAKCVRYSEMEFRALNVPPTPECVESLITVYHQLGYQDSAVGLITCVKERHSERIPMKADWLEKLNRYDDARAQYESENKNWETIFNDDSPPLGDLWLRRELGILRCLNHLGNFEELEHNALRLRRYIRDVEQVEEKAMWLSGLKQEDKVGWISQIQHLGANASWMLGHWNEMEEVGQRKI
jgi:FKBP12-rapamycin complex-associated protein